MADVLEMAATESTVDSHMVVVADRPAAMEKEVVAKLVSSIPHYWVLLVAVFFHVVSNCISPYLFLT